MHGPWAPLFNSNFYRFRLDAGLGHLPGEGQEGFAAFFGAEEG